MKLRHPRDISLQSPKPCPWQGFQMFLSQVAGCLCFCGGRIHMKFIMKPKMNDDDDLEEISLVSNGGFS